jgi:hypothetical protein
MQNNNLKRTLQDDFIDCEYDSAEDSVEAAVNISKGKKRTQVIYRAIVCYFLEKETLKNPHTFNPKIFLKNHPHLTIEAALKWKASTDLGIAKIFEKIKSGSVLPFEEQPNITWLRNGQLLPFRDVPIPLQQQYIADPMKFRVSETKIRKKKNYKYKRKLQINLYIQSLPKQWIRFKKLHLWKPMTMTIFKTMILWVIMINLTTMRCLLQMKIHVHQQ